MERRAVVLCLRYVGVPIGALLWDASMTTKTPVPTHVSCYTHSLNSDYIITQIVIKGEHFLTRVRTGHKGKLALIFMSMQVLQGADHLTALCCIHTAYLQPGQVIPHVPVSGKNERTHLQEAIQKKVTRKYTQRYKWTDLYRGLRLLTSRGSLSSGQER